MDLNLFRRRIAALKKTDDATRTQWAYIAEAAVEYFIAITTSGAFLTLLVKQMGVSDAVTGIISSFTTFACGMQLFTVAFIRRRKSIRRSVLVLQTLQQLLYSLLYLLPFLPISQTLQVGLFVVLFLSATLMSNLVAPAKYNWMMYFVKPEHRGIFSAHKEMVSLITGMIYNYVMSLVVDHFEAIGRPEVGLIMCFAVIFLMMILHVITLLLSKDAPEVLEETRKTASLTASLKSNLTNPTFLKILVMSCGWGLFSWISTAYYSVFMLQEVGSSVTYIATVSLVSSLVRFFVSPSMGKFCDKKGYARGLRLGFMIAAVGFALLVFWRPANGKIFYMIYSVLHSVALTSINSGMSNVLLEYIPVKDRVGGLGLYSAITGIVGFTGSLIGGWILNAVQASGNQVLGMNIYGQQILSLITFTGVIGLILYNTVVVQKLKKAE